MAPMTSSRKPGAGKIVIISSPSGGGKTTICRELLNAERREQGWRFSISHTTRPPRVGEKDGREYHFVDDATFDRMIEQGFFAEHFQVHEFKYGTPRRPLDEVREHGGVMVLDVDVNGAKALKQEFPDAITIFILPPSIAALRERLQQRGTETTEQMEMRFENALREMRTFQSYGFEYVVVNKDLTVAVEEVLSVVIAHHCRLEHFPPEQLKNIVS
ncbi:guanylate kinase [candidate division GN15 bacterium]|nr:guanylate kinase [candidate division GN15 bacterium]